MVSLWVSWTQTNTHPHGLMSSVVLIHLIDFDSLTKYSSRGHIHFILSWKVVGLNLILQVEKPPLFVIKQHP